MSRRDPLQELTRARQTFDEVLEEAEVPPSRRMALYAAASAWAKASAIASLAQLARGLERAPASGSDAAAEAD